MKTFEVKIREVHYTIVKVEAEDETSAREMAQNLLQDGTLDDAQYDYTLDSDEWSVWEA